MAIEDNKNESNNLHKVELKASSKTIASVTIEKLRPLNILIASSSLFAFVTFVIGSAASYISDLMNVWGERTGRILQYGNLIIIFLSIAIAVGSVFTVALWLYKRRITIKEQAILKIKNKEQNFFQRIQKDVDSLLKERHQYGK